ncbi:MAG: O-methyltransferase [Alphaproteobacteria bacterium]|nr:O-methyltransferase [Alphaproteobacteria bacterium]MDE2336270.1 O-methyltransferase [Alphaproteobacteria bacterium]
MADGLWAAVDGYIDAALVFQDDALRHALAETEKAGAPAINVSPAQGKLLYLLAKLVNARRILEIGALGGYSAIWMGSALPEGGRLVTIEHSWKYAALARANIVYAGLSDKVEVVEGAGLDVLPALEGPFDLIFIDADKPNNPEYFRWAMKLCREGGAIVVDNVVRGGGVIDAENADSSVQGVRRMNELIAREPRAEATAIQTVGAKGYDGFCLIRVAG